MPQPIFATVTYNVSGRDANQKETVETKRELWGPFPDDEAFNAYFDNWYGQQHDWKTKHVGYNHKFVPFVVQDGVPTLYRVPKDKGVWHPYRVFIQPHNDETADAASLNMDRSDTWGVQRGQEWLTGVKVEDLQPGDRISVPYRHGHREETVVRVERVELYWFE